MTGRYPLSTGTFLNDIQMSITETTIPHVLQDAGYDTAYIGKWHLDGSRRFGFTPPGPPGARASITGMPSTSITAII